MYDAFISYRRKNGFAVAKMLRDQLKERKIFAFVDLEELKSGIFDEKILLAIKNSPAFILVLYPGDLDHCGDEGDWLAKEIDAAVTSDRKIIPVLCNGFEWPKVWNENIPENIKIISKFNSVTMSQEYLGATISKIVSYVNEGSGKDDEDVITSPVSDTNHFFLSNMKDLDSIESVDLSFHAGFIWHQDIGHLDILSAFDDAGIPVRVVINTEDGALIIGKHMRHKLKKYPTFEEGISSWKSLESTLDNMQVRLSDIPVMRICYCINKKNKSESVMRIKFYTYGNPKIDDNYIQDFTPADHPFELYKKEFEYLWKNGKSE